MFQKRCNNPISINEIRQEYCCLPRGHSGKCTNVEPKPKINLRCESISPTGKHCGHRKGHPGSHSRYGGHATAEIW